MALRPTGPGEPQVPAPRRRTASAPTSTPAPQAPTVTAQSRQERGFRLKAAVSPDEIERQIRRLMTLIANDNIDPDAPPGSYINMII